MAIQEITFLKGFQKLYFVCLLNFGFITCIKNLIKFDKSVTITTNVKFYGK